MSDLRPIPVKGPEEGSDFIHKMEAQAEKNPFEGVSFEDLEISLYRPRTRSATSDLDRHAA